MTPARTLPWLLALLVIAALAATAGARQKDKKEEKKNVVKKTAKLTVKLPEDDATLWIEGKEMKFKTPAKERKFESPPLPVGEKFVYAVVAEWEPNNYTRIRRTRQIFVEGGKEYTLDLTKEDKNQPDKIVIRYVPTPEEVVDAMLKLARVG